jgi:uncharacterized protein YoxC
MSIALQAALILASLALSALVACMVPIAFQVRRRLDRMALTAERLEANVTLLVHDSREMARSVNELAHRASQPVDDATRVVRLVQQWTERADRLVSEVGSAIEPPVLSLVRSASLLGAGTATFLRALFHPNHNGNPANKEDDHV